MHRPRIVLAATVCGAALLTAGAATAHNGNCVFRAPFDALDAQDLARWAVEGYLYKQHPEDIIEVDLRRFRCAPHNPAKDRNGKAGWRHVSCTGRVDDYGRFKVLLHRRPVTCGYLANVTPIKS